MRLGHSIIIQWSHKVHFVCQPMMEDLICKLFSWQLSLNSVNCCTISLCYSFASTQWMDIIQIAISECLKVPENKIKVTVKRVGGGFGGKISRSSQVACACALSCYLSGLPVRFVMTIEAMMSICGKRYPCAHEYNVICSSITGKVHRLNNLFVEDYGCSLNERVPLPNLAAFTNGYVSNGWQNTERRLLTNTSCSTFCRAPGSCEAIGNFFLFNDL